jgi:hypothetical protein
VLRILIRLSSLILGLTQLLSAQAPPTSQCKVLDIDKPALYISYHGPRVIKDNDGKTAPVTVLRLHNNSSCSIKVETTDTSGNEILNRKQTTQVANGSITRYIPNPPKDFGLEIFYDVKESDGKSWKPGNYWKDRDISFSYPIPPGYSAAFPVQEEFYRKKQFISVPFNYTWETGSNNLYTVSHRVLYFHEFPRGFYIKR